MPPPSTESAPPPQILPDTPDAENPPAQDHLPRREARSTPATPIPRRSFASPPSARPIARCFRCGRVATPSSNSLASSPPHHWKPAYTATAANTPIQRPRLVFRPLADSTAPTPALPT